MTHRVLRISDLTIRNFRNLARIDVTLPESGVVLVGGNGQGKTNFLEAVYYPVLFRSLRGARDRDLVRFGEDGFFIGATADRRITAGFEVEGKRKKVTLEGQPVARLSDAVGSLAAVSFSPADRDLVTGGPTTRRRYLDVVLSLSHHRYLRQLTAYRNAARQRNAALRRKDEGTAIAFDNPMVEAAVAITHTRAEWANRWANRYAELCTLLGEKKAPLMEYRTRHWELDETGDDLHRQLGRTLERDLRHGSTSVGPHRDELRLRLADHDLRTFGSAGQQRTAAMALRILEAETLRAETGVAPIALYDDVFVELDETRQANLLALIQEALPGQAIITAPRDSEVPPELCDRPRWTMDEGNVVTG